MSETPDLTTPTPPDETNGAEQTPPVVEQTAVPTMPPPPSIPADAAPTGRATLPPEHTPTETPTDNFTERLERLGGEPAPVITPEEFARLQNAGQVHIDAMGRVRTARRASQADAGVTLRKRRAWY